MSIFTSPPLGFTALRVAVLALGILLLSPPQIAHATPPPPAPSYSELEGYWMGDYGPNGMELIEVTVVANVIVAAKITGDPHVPAGNATWWGSLATHDLGVHLSTSPGGELETVAGRLSIANGEQLIVEIITDEGEKAALVFRRPNPEEMPSK